MGVKGLDLAMRVAIKSISIFLTILLVLTIIFALFHIGFGNHPVSWFYPRMPGMADEPSFQQYAEEYHADDGLGTQYVNLIYDYLTGDLRSSYSMGYTSINDFIWQDAAITLILVVLGIGHSILLSMFFGWIVVRSRRRWVGVVIHGISLLAMAIPVLAISVLLILSSDWLSLDLPPYGSGFEPYRTERSYMDHTVLPSFVAVVTMTGLFTLLLREATLTRKLAGEPYRPILNELPKALLALRPLTNYVITFAFGIILLIDAIFSYHGIGTTALRAAYQMDFGLFMACIYVISLMALALNLFLTFLMHICARSSLNDVTEGWLAQGHTERVGSVALPAAARVQTRLMDACKSFSRSLISMGALVTFLALLMLGVLAPVLATVYDPMDFNNLDRPLLPPSLEPSPEYDMIHPLGTDDLGRDVYSMWLVASKNGVLLALAAMLISVAIGLMVGLILPLLERPRKGSLGLLDNLVFSAIARTSATIPLVILGMAAIMVMNRDHAIYARASLLIWMYAWAWIIVVKRGWLMSDPTGSNGTRGSRFSEALACSLHAAKFVVPTFIIIDTALISMRFSTSYVATWGGLIENAYWGAYLVEGGWASIVLPVTAGMCALVGSVFAILDRFERALMNASVSEISSQGDSIPAGQVHES